MGVVDDKTERKRFGFQVTTWMGSPLSSVLRTKCDIILSLNVEKARQ